MGVVWCEVSQVDGGGGGGSNIKVLCCVPLTTCLLAATPNPLSPVLLSIL